VSRSSTAQESCPAIQILQDRMVLILEPVNSKGNDNNAIPDARSMLVLPQQ